MLLDIVKYGDPVLARRAEDVTEFDAALQKLVDDMFETMYAAHGVGLAAPQVGSSKRLFVMDCGTEREPKQKVALANPVIELEEEEQAGDEGCLSVPGFFFPIRRARQVTVRGQDPAGHPVTMRVSDLEARCVAHEINHLDGKLILSHLSPLKRDMAVRKIKKLVRRGEW